MQLACGLAACAHMNSEHDIVQVTGYNYKAIIFTEDYNSLCMPKV